MHRPRFVHGSFEGVVLFYQTFELRNVPAHHIQARPPEFFGRNVYAEAGGKRAGVGQACRGQQIVVAGAESGGVLLGDGVQAQAEQQSERIRIVVEGGAVIVPLEVLHTSFY